MQKIGEITAFRALRQLFENLNKITVGIHVIGPACQHDGVQRGTGFCARRGITKQPIEKRIVELNAILTGWKNYFNQGPVRTCYRDIDNYAARRLRIWMQRRKGRRGTGPICGKPPQDEIYLGFFRADSC